MRSVFYTLALLILVSCGSLPSRHRHANFSPADNSVDINYRRLPKNPYTESSCREPNSQERKLLLALANPHNYPHLKYKLGARNPSSSMDCSSFVHHVYQKAGLPYNFRPTQTLKNAPEFDVLPEEMGKPGDLILFRGHVGIINEDNLVISSTRIRSKYQNSSITVMDRGNFPGIRGRRYVLRYNCMPSERSIASKDKKSKAKILAKRKSKPSKRSYRRYSKR